MSTDLSSITTPHSTLQPPASSILSFSEGTLETIKPSPCTAPCGVAAYHAAGIGPVPELCDKEDRPFISAYENCAACIEQNDESGEGILKPELQQALAYCDIDVDFESSAKSSSETGSSSAEGSADESSADESIAEETSSPSGEAEGDEDDDSAGSHLVGFGPLLGGVAGLLHFIFI